MPLFNQMNICIVLISVHKDDQYPFWKYNFLLIHLFRAVKCLIPSLLHLCYALKDTEALTKEVQKKNAFQTFGHYAFAVLHKRILLNVNKISSLKRCFENGNL